MAVRPFNRITVDPRVMNGQPRLRGMRLTAKRVVSLAAQRLDRKALRADDRGLGDDIRQALQYSASMGQKAGEMGMVSA